MAKPSLSQQLIRPPSPSPSPGVLPPESTLSDRSKLPCTLLPAMVVLNSISPVARSTSLVVAQATQDPWSVFQVSTLVTNPEFVSSFDSSYPSELFSFSCQSSTSTTPSPQHTLNPALLSGEGERLSLFLIISCHSRNLLYHTKIEHVQKTNLCDCTNKSYKTSPKF
jgi:hypothetical protein